MGGLCTWLVLLEPTVLLYGSQKIFQPFPLPVVCMNEPDDTTLMERCIKGDRQAFEQLLVRYENGDPLEELLQQGSA